MVPMGPPRSQAPPPDSIHMQHLEKAEGGTRVLVHLGDEVSRRYAAAVAAVVPAVENALTPVAVANRALSTPTGFRLEPWRSARARLRRAVATCAAGPLTGAFLGDVRDCYGSMTPDAVASALVRSGASDTGVLRIVEILRGFEERGVRGLPVGPPPSAVLANAVLASVDRALAEAAEGPVLRWVDDVIVFTTGPRGARRAAASFERSLGHVGLVPHPAKCRIVDVSSSPIWSARYGSTTGCSGVA